VPKDRAALLAAAGTNGALGERVRDQGITDDTYTDQGAIFMNHHSLFSVPTMTALVFGGLCASACAGPDDTFEVSGDSVAFHGESSIAALSAQEATTYRADMAYVRSLMPVGGGTVTLNHADDRQHRFVLARLKMMGKTAENSPELFKNVEALRTQHIAAGLASKQGVAELHVEANDVGGQAIQDTHRLVALDIVNNGTQLKVASMASVHTTGLTHGLVDAIPWDIDGNQIGNEAFVEVFGPMPYASPAALGNLSQTHLDTLLGDSILEETTVANGQQELYTFATRARKNLFNPPVNIGPVDVNNDGCINVCVSRVNADCDYNLVGNALHDFQLPIQGNVSLNTTFFAQGYRIDTARIAQYAAGTATDNNVPPQADPGGNITVTLTNTGGGCSSTNPNNTLTLPEQLFWQTVTVTNGGQTLNWNMDGAHLADFGIACAVPQDHVELDVTVEVPYVDPNGNTGIMPIFISNGANASPTQPPIPACFHVIDSCLAKGTMIEMANGRSAPIETIHAGDQVFSPYDHTDSALAVMDTTKGTERIPMVHIQDERGRSLLMTETHPIEVPGRGMVMSKYLNEGDVVMTKSGPSRLVHVSREHFTGTVHNLKVGNRAELASLGKDQTAVYANGFLVGDTQIQHTYDLAELSQVGRPTPVMRVANRWRRDYEHMKLAQR
jgi:hypothetical protein